MNDSTTPANGSMTAKTRDYGNLFCMVMFLSLGAGSFVQHARYDALAWFSLGLSFLLMRRSPGITGENWKKPLSLLAIALVLIGTGMIVVKVILTATGRLS